jgi:hypothetical protein
MTSIRTCVNHLFYDFTTIVRLTPPPRRGPRRITPAPPIIGSAHSLPRTASLRYAGRMSASAPDPEKPNEGQALNSSEGGKASDPAATSAQPSRVRSAWVGGHFDPGVMKALKTLALREETTVQSLIGRALNDLLEQAGLGRPASETVLPRGGAAHRRRDRQSP